MVWLCAAVCFGVACLWAYSTRHSVIYIRDDWYINLFSGVVRFEQGPLIAIQRSAAAQQQPPKLSDLFKKRPPPATTPPPSEWSILRMPSAIESGYGFRMWQWTYAMGGHHAVLPLWTAFTFFATSALFFSWLGRKRRFRGICNECGYDLTGNTTGVCPECGTGFVGRALGDRGA